MRMPKLRKAYFFARNKRQRTVPWCFWYTFCHLWLPTITAVHVETKIQLVKRCNILEIALQVIIFSAVVAVLLLISSSLIADDARELNDIGRYIGHSVDKLSAAAVCRNFKLQWNPLLFWHLHSGDNFYSRDTSIQGKKNLVPVKCSHNLCICYLYLFYRHQWNTKWSWAFVRKLGKHLHMWK